MTTNKRARAIHKRSRGDQTFLERLAGGALSFGQLLWAIREGEGMTQTKFAAELGISRSHLCDLEKSRKQVSVKLAAGYARKLGYSEAQFVRLALQDQLRSAGLKLHIHVEAA